MDFCGPFSMGEYLFVVIDAYSRFPEVDIVHSTSASAIIPKMDRIFSTHGIPCIVRSDNGPPFTSDEIKKYMEENGIKHYRTTPLWPQANSEAENFMKPLAKAVRSAYTKGKVWKKHLHKFLLNYQTTPHCMTGFTPAQLLFSRTVRNKLPQFTSNNQVTGQKVLKKNEEAKTKMKAHADARSRAKPSNITIGDLALVRQRKQNKLSTRFNPSPFCVTSKRRTMITAQRNGNYITRNTSHFKLVDSSLQESTNDEEEEDDDEIMTDEQIITGESRGQTTDIRHSQRRRKTFKTF